LVLSPQVDFVTYPQGIHSCLRFVDARMGRDQAKHIILYVCLGENVAGVMSLNLEKMRTDYADNVRKFLTKSHLRATRLWWGMNIFLITLFRERVLASTSQVAS
jgi:hypothetical protein